MRDRRLEGMQIFYYYVVKSNKFNIIYQVIFIILLRLKAESKIEVLRMYGLAYRK
jgi:hypothetical protein